MTTPSSSPALSDSADWWRTACIYQLYPRSFADSNGDGIGDIAGMIARLGYLRELGVDAVWVTPWFASPMADGGYDVADYRAIADVFGSLSDALAFLAEAHRLGLRMVLDLVPNHTSTEHAWFGEARRLGPGSAAAGRYWIRPGCGPGGQLPPNDWRSVFGGCAWSPLTTVGGHTWQDPASGAQDWYLHLFAPEQPDLNWANPDVPDEFDAILRFWFDHGVDGFRIDVAHGLSKNPALPDIGDPPASAGLDTSEVSGAAVIDHPHWDRDENVSIFRRWRAIADSYAPTAHGRRLFVAEAWRIRPDGLSRYLEPGSLHTAFNLDLLAAKWDAEDFRARIRDHLRQLGCVGAPATWVLGSHDITRVATRLGRDIPWSEQRVNATAPVDLELGMHRARAAALLVLALPGSCYIYQGDELGLPEVEDLPEDVLADPMWHRSGRTVRGRDGCRVPLPWAARSPHLGFSNAQPWLPQPSNWTALAIDRQQTDPDSTLRLYQHALALRSELLAPDEPPLLWVTPDESTVLSFDRTSTLRCIVNFGEKGIELPAGFRVLLASAPIGDEGRLVANSAAWLTGTGSDQTPPITHSSSARTAIS